MMIFYYEDDECYINCNKCKSGGSCQLRDDNKFDEYKDWLKPFLCAK